ncbi:MAG TPA: sulfotransferase [Acidimicrobiales bacterium]
MDTPRYDQDTLVDTAIAAAGSNDLGEDSWQEGLGYLLEDLDGPAQLNALGRTVAEADVVGYLTTRLRILEWRRTHPEVADGTITRPIVIVGQPRTGTTILYDLLAQDPDNRAPLTWEVDQPVPPPETATYDTDPRIEEADAIASMPDLIIPGFTDFHPLGARLAQECVRMTGGDFRSMIFPTQYDVPEYNRWLMYEADMAPAYRWHRIFLQHLQSRHGSDRWLLKSPAHLWCLRALLDEYPDALIIQTHRDPVRVISSISALAALLRRMSTDHSSVPRAADLFSEDILLGLDRSVAARRDGTVPADQVVDVQFGEFMADPFTTIGTVYDRLGLTFTAEAEAAMREFLATHPGDGGGGGSRYTFADTGLDAAEMRERSRAYQEYFDVPSEPIA